MRSNNCKASGSPCSWATERQGRSGTGICDSWLNARFNGRARGKCFFVSGICLPGVCSGNFFRGTISPLHAPGQ